MLNPIVPAAAGPTALDWVKAAGPVFSGLGGKSAGPSRADSSAYTSSPFDSSGWVVNMGSGSASAVPASSPWTNLAMFGALALVGVFAWKKLRS